METVDEKKTLLCSTSVLLEYTSPSYVRIGINPRSMMVFGMRFLLLVLVPWTTTCLSLSCRRDFVSLVATSMTVAVAVAPVAQAAESKGSAYEACMSQCLYDCTKPKVPYQKSRAECLPECKQECKATKAQAQG